MGLSFQPAILIKTASVGESKVIAEQHSLPGFEKLDALYWRGFGCMYFPVSQLIAILRVSKPEQQATWGGRFNQKPSALMLNFSESISFDHRLAPFDIECSRAHAAMLCHVGLITQRELVDIHRGLSTVLNSIRKGTFVWDPAFEDVHMNIEQALLKNTPTAAKLHTARSRNDQVATDMRLFFKDACQTLRAALDDLQTTLLDIAEAHQQLYLPGYTHLQRAQPVSAAHYLLAYVEMFGRDSDRLDSVADHANWCPLGSGALAGTTLPIDRAYTARCLGFVDKKGRPRLTPNSLDAVADRDLFVEFAAALAIIGSHLSRIAEDMILWNSAEFSFIDLPEAFTTGSSLMPQKKNPDALELIRGKAARIQGNLTTLLTLIKGLPLTYNRDLQEDKPPVFDAFDQTLICLHVLKATLSGLTFRTENCAAAVQDPTLLATDLVDYLVRKGVPFREAHHRIGALVALAEKNNVPLNHLDDVAVREVDQHFKDDWRHIFDIPEAMRQREQPGMPGPRQVKQQIRRWRRALRRGKSSVVNN